MNACVQADSSTLERHGSSFADKSVAVLITVDDVSGLAKEATLRQRAALGGWQQRWHVFLSTIHDTIMSICLGFVGPSGTGCQWLMHSPIVLQAVHVTNSCLLGVSGVLLDGTPNFVWTIIVLPGCGQRINEHRFQLPMPIRRRQHPPKLSATPHH